jgi:hypothetical protein
MSRLPVQTKGLIFTNTPSAIFYRVKDRSKTGPIQNNTKFDSHHVTAFTINVKRQIYNLLLSSDTINGNTTNFTSRQTFRSLLRNTVQIWILHLIFNILLYEM